jgi:glyoxylase-like metal-dependent hydrolase (beta-lactamase superfamily II)
MSAAMDENKPFFLDTLIVSELQINCYLLGCRDTREAAIIDPGGDSELIIDKVAERQAIVKMILLTHGHFDHIGALDKIRKEYRCPVLIHSADANALTNPMINLSALTGNGIVSSEAEQLLKDGDRIQLGKLTLEVLHTPGHTRGGVCFKYDGLLFCGDTLFNSGIGRTDLPGGNITQLEQSIREKLFALPDDTLVLPGHGEPTSIGLEKTVNPFVRLR